MSTITEIQPFRAKMLNCEVCQEVKCFDHFGQQDLKCVNCESSHSCVRQLDLSHGNSSAKNIEHSHVCMNCGKSFSHTHDLAHADSVYHPMVCPSCARGALRHHSIFRKHDFADLVKIATALTILIAVIALFAWFLPSLFTGFFAPIQSALGTVNNVTEESGEVVRTAAHLVGAQLKKTIQALGEDEEEIQNTVLHVTKVASLLTSKHINRTMQPVLSAANSVSALTGDLLEFASTEIRTACWIVACLFLSEKHCNEQFYTEFSLCENPLHNITEKGVSYMVTAPCAYHGQYIQTDATKQYDDYVKNRVYTTFTLAVETSRQNNELTLKGFEILMTRFKVYEHLLSISEQECSLLKPFLQRDCLKNHCVDKVNSKLQIDPEKLTAACLYQKHRAGVNMFI